MNKLAMKKILLLLCFPIFSLAQGPAANFIWSPNPACLGLPLCFVDSSISSTNTPIAYWSWSFSDGTLSTDQNPTHIFNSSGGYMVTLTIVDIAGSIDDTTIWVAVDDCSTSCSANGLYNYQKSERLLKTIDILGRDAKQQLNSMLIEIYDDGTFKKKIIIE